MNGAYYSDNLLLQPTPHTQHHTQPMDMNFGSHRLFVKLS
jgi:hypothetical protein